MNRQAILRAVLAAALIAAWIPWLFPFPTPILQMRVMWLVSKLVGWEFPPAPPNDDLTLEHAWVLGPLVFVTAIITILPFALALLYSFPRDRGHMRAWDAIALAVGAVSVIGGGWSSSLLVLGDLGSGARLSRDYYLSFFALPLFVVGTIATFSSYRMLKSQRSADLS